tara:strand:+ start:1062 stop:2303 length:1242 start_codon:yes stop_codon:yes gene_type:complete
MKFKNMQVLNDVVMDYSNPFKMYALAREYDALKQGAAAFGWYLRAADFCAGETYEEKMLQYKCMILCAEIFDRSGDRGHSVMGLLKMAVATMPERPEAYYFLAKNSKATSNWRDSLMYAQMGLKCDLIEKLDNDLDYPGQVGLKYIYAISKWKSDGRDDSKNFLFDLKHKELLPSDIRDEVTALLDKIGYPSTLAYKKADVSKYRFAFEGLDDIETNYSRHFQDMFVLSMLNGKREGTFVEIGSGHPTLFNNTYLLENKFGWKGISVEHSERMCAQFSRERTSNIIFDNAATLDYGNLFKQHCLEQHIDFLRINSDQSSLNAVKSIPFNKYEFSIIQFQHNDCWWGPEIKEMSRKVLKDIGYVLFVNDIAIDGKNSYEDWWVHPAFIKSDLNNKMKSNKSINFAWDYMMKERK